jgi:hypothetical protein
VVREESKIRRELTANGRKLHENFKDLKQIHRKKLIKLIVCLKGL